MSEEQLCIVGLKQLAERDSREKGRHIKIKEVCGELDGVEDDRRASM